MSGKIFELRMGAVKGKPLSAVPFPDVILCELGNHTADLDVIEKLADKEWLEIVRKESIAMMEKVNIIPALGKPIGFSIGQLPVGAVITIVSDSR